MLEKAIARYKEAYSGLPSPVWMLAGVEFVNRAGTMVLFFMTLYMTRHLGFSLTEAGRAISGYGLGSLAGTYLGGRLCDAIGCYHVQRLALGLTGVVLFVLGLPTSPLVVTLLMFALGAVSEALHPANLVGVSQNCPPELRMKGFSLNRLAANLGISIGPVLGGYLALVNYHFLFWVDGFTSFAALALFMVFFGMKAGPLAGEARAAVPRGSPFRDRILVLLLSLTFLVALVFSQLFSTFPLYVRGVYGLPENAIGQLIAVNTLIIVVTEMLIIHSLQGHDPALIVRIGSVLLCGGFALMPFGSGFFYAAVTVAVWTFGEILTLPLVVTLVAARASETEQGRYQGLLTLSFSCAMIAGPSIGSWIYNRFSPDVLWYACGLLGVCLAAGFTWLSSLMRAERSRQ